MPGPVSWRASPGRPTPLRRAVPPADSGPGDEDVHHEVDIPPWRHGAPFGQAQRLDQGEYVRRGLAGVARGCPSPGADLPALRLWVHRAARKLAETSDNRCSCAGLDNHAAWREGTEYERYFLYMEVFRLCGSEV